MRNLNDILNTECDNHTDYNYLNRNNNIDDSIFPGAAEAQFK